MVGIPAGTFVMGSPSSEGGRSSDETQHQVPITKSFYMAETPVTQELYQAVMGESPSYNQNPKNPVESVSGRARRTLLPN